MNVRSRNRAAAASVVGVICTMVGASFVAVPLYRLFCAATGFAGTPNFAQTAASGATGASIKLRMNADVAPGMPWNFAPNRTEIQLQLGEDKVAFYQATNLADEAVSGVSLYNVTPEKVGRYFHKTACFCLNQQTLAPRETMQFPVSFWIDPAIRTDPNTADVKTITLSYVFYRSTGEAEKAGAFAKAGPHVGQLTGQDRSAQDTPTKSN